uniref:DOMON domain-containing protein n=1 Tax=Elaeophora elaphi TaxID=1147741 RepID=A0A0R3RYA7_9BILA
MTCATSSSTHQDAIQLDKFRIIAQLPHPSCSMEPIRCDRDQDVCVTITMNIKDDGFYWIGAGCDRQEYFQHTACKNIRTFTRNVQLGTVQERRVLQRLHKLQRPEYPKLLEFQLVMTSSPISPDAWLLDISDSVDIIQVQ